MTPEPLSQARCPIPWSSELLSLARRHPTRIAVRDGEGVLRFDQLARQAHHLADWLAKQGNPAPRRIAVLLGNDRHHVVADYAISILGACIVHLAVASSDEELARFLATARADLVLTLPAMATRVSGTGVRVCLVPSLDDLDTEAAPTQAWPAADPGAPARVLFTSGTSGPPKAVVYSHYKRWLAATVLRSVLPYRPDGSGILLMTPYMHGASMLARAWLDCGGWAWLQDGVQPGQAGAALDDPGIEAVFAPPSALRKLIDGLGSHPRPMRCVFTGTQPLPATLYERARQIFGPSIRVTYGKSENLNPITVLERDDCARLYEDMASGQMATVTGCCVGHPGPGVELRIAEDGSVLLRSQHQFDGYLDASGNWLPHLSDQWHDSGDLGRIDSEGRLWLTGRRDRVINSGGYMLDPDEAADAIRTLPEIADALVVGLPSEYWTQVTVCGYVAGPGAVVSEARLRGAVSALTQYKCPRLFVALEEMPVTAAGKPSPRGLLDHLEQTYRLRDGPRPELQPRTG